MKYILVTGAAGYIGSKVVYDLIDNGHKIIAIDNLSNGNKKVIPKNCIFIKADITKSSKLEKIFRQYKIISVYHFAAKKKVDESQKFPLKYFESNVIGTKNLLDLIIKYKVKNLIFSSTCAVYGNNLNSKVSEKSLSLPESYYGYTKLISENTIIEYQKRYKFNYAILRYFNVVGADNKLRTGEMKSGSLFKKIHDSFKSNKKFIVYGNDYKTKDKTCIRDYIDLNDLSKLHLKSHSFINNKKKSIIFNCGYSRPISVLDVVRTFEKICKKKINIRIGKRRFGDLEKIFSDNTLQKKLFPLWEPKYDLVDSVKSTLNWEKKIINYKFKSY
jgi:UDP-glucose 4-epimerase